MSFREFMIISLVLGYFISVCFYTLALRYSHRGRVTLLLQPKRVTRKGRHISYAPKKQGFPAKGYCYHAAPELAHVEKHARSDNWRRQPMLTIPFRRLAKVDWRSKSNTVST